VAQRGGGEMEENSALPVIGTADQPFSAPLVSSLARVLPNFPFRIFRERGGDKYLTSSAGVS